MRVKTHIVINQRVSFTVGVSEAHSAMQRGRTFSMKLSPFRAIKALYSLAMLVRDPDRLNQVFEMADALGTPEAMTPIVDRVARDPRIARAIAERHRIPRINLDELKKLPEGTLGRTFAEHMFANKLDPSALPDLPSSDRRSRSSTRRIGEADRIMFFRAHLYETHDIWHVITGFRTDLVGELGLQSFYLSQIPGPLPSLLVAVGFLRSGIYDQELTNPFMEALIRGWRLGKKAQPLFGVHWDEMWEQPIEDVRRKLGIEIEIEIAARTEATAEESAKPIAA
jgi:ubiquinone biosynthesis protein COQ4